MNIIPTPELLQFLKTTTRAALERSNGSKFADGLKTDGKVEHFLASQFGFNSYYELARKVKETPSTSIALGNFGTYIHDYGFTPETHLSAAEALFILTEHAPMSFVSLYESKAGSRTRAIDITDIKHEFYNKGFVIFEETCTLFRAIYRHDDNFLIMKKSKTEHQHTPTGSETTNPGLRLIEHAGYTFIEAIYKDGFDASKENKTIFDLYTKGLESNWRDKLEYLPKLLTLFDIEDFERNHYPGNIADKSNLVLNISQAAGLLLRNSLNKFICNESKKKSDKREWKKAYKQALNDTVSKT